MNSEIGRRFAPLLTAAIGLMMVLAVGSSGPRAAEKELRLPDFKEWTGDLEGMEKRRLIRILVPFSRTIYFIDKGVQMGTAVEFGTQLGKTLNASRKKELERMRIAYVPMRRDKLVQALKEGRGDIIAANLTITSARAAEVDFTDPFAEGVAEILVSGPKAPKVSSLYDLAGKTVEVRESSSYYGHLLELNRHFRREGKPEIKIVKADEYLEDEDLLEMVNAGLLPWCIVDDHKARLWAKIFDQLQLHEDISIHTDGRIAWAVRKDSPKLMAMLNDFIKEHKSGTTFGNIIKKRYYGSDKIVRSLFEGRDLDRYRELRESFIKHGAAFGFDHLLLAAQGFQESQLDQRKRSNRGAVGVMQMLPSTASDKAVGITGIAESADKNIEAGSKYMRFIVDDRLGGEDIDVLNETLLALAGYNAGPGNLNKIRRTTGEMGLDPNVWFGNAEHGAAKVIGRETVQYVGNIYKYYIAYRSAADLVDRSD